MQTSGLAPRPSSSVSAACKPDPSSFQRAKDHTDVSPCTSAPREAEQNGGGQRADLGREESITPGVYRKCLQIKRVPVPLVRNMANDGLKRWL